MADDTDYTNPEESNVDPGQGYLTYDFLGFDANNKDVYRGSDGNLYTGGNGPAGMVPYTGDFGQAPGETPPVAPVPPMYGGVPGPEQGPIEGGGPPGGYAGMPAATPSPPPPPTYTPPSYTPPVAPPVAQPGPAVPTAPVAPAPPAFNPDDDAFDYEIPAAPVFAPPTWTPPPGFAPPEIPTAPAFSYQDFALPDAQAALQDPGYQFRLNEGQQALLNNRASRGLLSTGGTLKDFLKYNQNFATQEYGNVVDRAADLYRTNRGNALDAYNKNYQTQYVDPFEAKYRGAADAYTQNYKTQYADPYEMAYKGALDVHGGAMKNWETQAADAAHKADERRRYAWLIASGGA